MKRKYYINIVFLFYSTFTFCGIKSIAQEDMAVVTGLVADKSTKQPIEFATVQLLNTSDSSIIKTTVSDRKGKFLLDNIIMGQYVLRFSFIGYTKINLPITVNKAKENISTVEIALLAKDMNEVIVTTRKSLLNTSIDRKIYNVSQDILAQSGSASDVLKNVPSIEVDIDGNVSLRGSQDVMILINGRPSPLMGKSKAEILQQLPANSIERIEVITNPSARYKPDGTSGIINIVMKKSIKMGSNGSVIVNAGNRDRYNATISLNHKPGKLNIFGNYNIRQDYRIRVNNITREYLDSIGKTQSYYAEDNQSPARPLSKIVTVGADFTLNKQNTIGLFGNYHKRDQIKQDVIKKLFYDKNNLLTASNNRLRYDPEYEKEKDATVYWQHNFLKEVHVLRAELNISASDEVEDNHYTTVYNFPALSSLLDNTLIKQKDNQQELTIDYTNPLSENAKLETGYNGSFNQVDMDFYGEYYDAIQRRFVKDMIKSNRFNYSEAIHALYCTYQHSNEKFGYSAGLRLEQAYIEGLLVNKDSLISNQYFKIYPTLHLSYMLKKGELQLNYSRRVNRPDGDNLNPFPEYQDPFNIRAGNPKLLPELTHSVEVGFKWQNEQFSFVPSLYYRFKQNGFTTVIIKVNDSVLLTTEQNLSNDRSTGLELIFSANAGKFLSANLSSNFFYNQIDASNLGYSAKKSVVSMSANFNATATVTKTTMFQLSCNYRSARLIPQGKTFATFVLNSGIRQDLFKKKVTLTLTVSDLFRSLKQKTELNSLYIKQVAVGRRDARIFYAGISYRFGKVIKKQSEEKLQFDNAL